MSNMMEFTDERCVVVLSQWAIESHEIRFNVASMNAETVTISSMSNGGNLKTLYSLLKQWMNLQNGGEHSRKE